MVSSRSEIKLSSGGARCLHNNTGLQEKKKKKSSPFAVLFPPAPWGPQTSLLRLLTFSPPVYWFLDWVASGQTTNREGAQPHSSAEFELKVYWAWHCPPEQDLPHSQSLPSGTLHKPLSLIYQRTDRKSKKYNPGASRTETTVTESEPKWSHGSQPCEPLKADGSWWGALTKRGPPEKGMADHFSILAFRTPWTVWRGKKDTTPEMSPPGWQVSNKHMLLGESRQIAPERMKGPGQRGNTQL